VSEEENREAMDFSDMGPGGAILALVFVAFFMIVLIVFANGPESANAACLPLLVLLAVGAVAGIKLLLSGESSVPMTRPGHTHEVVRVETIRETVKVRCRYCGTLNLVTDTRCQACGGTL